MKNFSLTLVFIAFAFACFSQDAVPQSSSFNPTIKFKGLIHVRYDQSLTDSIDVQGKFNADPVQNSIRIRRLELRADISLNNHWSGVIRIQFPDLKTSTPGKAIELAYFEYKLNDQFHIRGGQFKPQFELDELTDHDNLRMIDRGTTRDLFVNNFYASYQPGIMVFGTFNKDKMPLKYYAGVFNGSDRSVTYDNNSQKNFLGRLEFTPVKPLHLGAAVQSAGINKETTGIAYGFDVSFIKDLSDKINLILEGEYYTGANVLSFTASSDSAKEVKNFMMAGYFGQALVRLKSNSRLFRVFEIGGKYENTDPSNTIENDAYRSITGGIGFIFLPDNDARLQFNVVNKQYEQELHSDVSASPLLNNTMFLAQLQLKI